MIFFGNHQRSQPHAEGIIVMTGVPDGKLFRLPGVNAG